MTALNSNECIAREGEVKTGGTRLLNNHKFTELIRRVATPLDQRKEITHAVVV